MKIICESKREVNTTETCRKEYCCLKMKWAMNNIKSKSYSDTKYPHLNISDKKIKMQTHSHYNECSEYAFIKYCPWCGTKITIEHEKIDNTGLPPVESLPFMTPVKKKKKHWWQ